MSNQEKVCTLNNTKFIIFEEDLVMLDKLSPVINGKKYSLPTPKFSPQARLQRRLNWRTEFHFFKRKSDFSGKDIIAQYSANSRCKVYTLDEWLSDEWDPLTYGIDYDPKKTFFSQFDILNQVVPKPALRGMGSENCEYTNSANYNKNCYLIASSSHNEHCFFGLHIQKSHSCFDCAFIINCSFCYQSIDCVNCNELQYSWNCKDCSNSYFLHSCKNCHNCFGSVNLHNAKYVFFNKQLDKDSYYQAVNKIKLSSYSNFQAVSNKFEEHRLKFPYSNFIGENNEQVFGNNISNSKNIWYSFDVTNLQDCRYCVWFHKANDCMDCYSWGQPAELCYECISCGDNATRCLFCSSCYSCSDVMYSNSLINCKNCFGCVSLKRKEYCIFNKQYSKSEYERLVPLIIQNMIRDNEWGEFFPFALADNYYNQSIANLYFPLNHDSVKNINANWNEEISSSTTTNFKIPNDTLQVDDSILQEVLCCENTSKPYKLIQQELKFYQQYSIPIPRYCPEERHRIKISKRLPRQFWVRICAKTGKKVYSSYSPDSKEIIWDNTEYLKNLYQ